LQSSVDNLREKLKSGNNLEIIEQLKEIENNIKNTSSKYDE